MPRPKSLVEAQARYDKKRASRRYVVRLSEGEKEGAKRLCRRGERIPTLLRRLLRERLENE
jgi:hypothetical protein